MTFKGDYNLLGIIFAVLERIKNTSSRNEKEEIVSEFADDPIIKKAFNFLFNDFITTGLDVKKIEKEFNSNQEFDKIDGILSMFEFLEKNNTGTGSVVKTVQAFIKDSAKTDEEVEFLKQLFTKTYKAGITAKTINKAFGEEFIPEFNVQLAHPYEKFANRVSGDFVLTTKLDGNRILAIVDEGGNAKFFTRNGKTIDGLGEIGKELKELANRKILSRVEFNAGFVLDGEVLIKNDHEYEDKFAETVKIVRKNGEKKDLVFWAFDILPLNEFYKGESTATYTEREAVLTSIFTGHEKEFVQRVEPLYIGSDVEVIPTYLQEVVGRGEEGLMLNLDVAYKCKRNPGLLKIKKFQTADVEVTGAFEGEGSFKGTLGGLFIDWKGYKVKVGSGFSLDERKEIWSKLETEETIVGQVIEIQFFSESTNQENDDISLRFPTFKTIRTDKTVEDVNYEF